MFRETFNPGQRDQEIHSLTESKPPLLRPMKWPRNFLGSFGNDWNADSQGSLKWLSVVKPQRFSVGLKWWHVFPADQMLCLCYKIQCEKYYFCWSIKTRDNNPSTKWMWRRKSLSLTCAHSLFISFFEGMKYNHGTEVKRKRKSLMAFCAV